MSSAEMVPACTVCEPTYSTIAGAMATIARCAVVVFWRSISSVKSPSSARSILSFSLFIFADEFSSSRRFRDSEEASSARRVPETLSTCRMTMDSARRLGVAAEPVRRAADTTPHATSMTR